MGNQPNHETETKQIAEVLAQENHPSMKQVHKKVVLRPKLATIGYLKRHSTKYIPKPIEK